MVSIALHCFMHHVFSVFRNPRSTSWQVAKLKPIHLVVAMGGFREPIAKNIVQEYERRKLTWKEVKVDLLKLATPTMCQIIEKGYLGCWEYIAKFIEKKASSAWGPEMTEELKRRIKTDGADVNARNAFGWTPLMVASLIDVGELTEALLDAGATPQSERAQESKSSQGMPQPFCESKAREAWVVKEIVVASHSPHSGGRD